MFIEIDIVSQFFHQRVHSRVGIILSFDKFKASKLCLGSKWRRLDMAIGRKKEELLISSLIM